MRILPFFASPRRTIAQLVLIGVLAACSSGSDNPIQDAAAAIEQQDYRSARIHLMTALRENGQDPEANFMFAKVHAELGDALTAESALKKLETNPAYAERIQPLRGRVMLLKGQNEEALALAENPSGEFAAQLYAIKAMALFGLNRNDDAGVVLAKALDVAPDNAELLWIKGNRELEIGDFDSAVRSSKRALKASPDSMEVLMLAGRVALAKADGKEALTHFAKVRKVRPDNIVAEYMRGAIFRDMGQRGEARACFETVLSGSPNHPLATYFLAQMDYEDGNSDKAYQRFQESEADIAELSPALRLSGLLELRRGNFEQAIDKLNRYLAQNPPDAESAMALSKALSAAGNDAQAYGAVAPLAQSVTAPASALKHAAKLAAKANSATASQYAQRATALQRDTDKNAIFLAEQAMISQDWARAAAIYDKLLKKDHPQKVMLLNNAAMVQLRLAKGDVAVKFAKQASDLAPDDPVVQDTLGWILLQTRTDKARALTLLQKAATRAPQNSEIQWHLANAFAANGQKAEARRIALKLSDVAEGNQKQQVKNLLDWI